jgi:hypothetical protein
MSFHKLLYSASALCLALTIVTPAQAQTSDDLGFDILQLLVDEGVIPREKAQLLLQKAQAAADLRRQSAPVTAATTAIDVPYVPEAVREQIKTEVKAEVVAQARTEGWLSPNSLPEWVGGIKISGDFRLRYQLENFSEDNFPFFPDVAAINAGGGAVDAAGLPLLNSTRDRGRSQFRARMNVDFAVSSQVKFGLRIAAGDVPGAISTNSTFGNFFDREDIWIDQAYAQITPFENFTVTGGRMPNPFYSTDMLWDRDISPEGLAISGRQALGGFTGFATVAVLPLQERELYDDSYLYGAQAGIEGIVTDGVTAKFAAAYYDLQNVQSLKNRADGSRLNDWSAPRFVAQGNSVFNMRTDGTTTLAGLASRFELVALTGEIALARGEIGFRLTGEVVKNLGVDKAEIDRLRGEPGVVPGDLGWQVRLDAGYPVIREAGQWRAAAAYKHVETDAVLDIFTDSDFGLGGTDVRGYVLEAEYGVYKNTALGVTYLSSDSISRPPFAVDVVQINLNTRF